MSALETQPWPLDEAIPRVCFKEDICRILRLSMRQLEELLKARTLPLVELDPIDRRPRFTGKSVQDITRGRWATNEPALRPGSVRAPRVAAEAQP